MVKSILLVALAIATLHLSAMETTKLRGYGQVTADFKDNQVRFECESEELAHRLYSKYTKDILKSGTNVPASETINGITVWRFENGTFGTAGVDGKAVVILAAKDKTTMEKTLKDVKLSYPQTGHPSYLDYYDHNAFRLYVRPMTSYGEPLDQHWPFIKRLGLGGIGVQEPSLSKSPAEGIIPFIKVDYEMSEAEKNHGMVVLGPCFGGSLPLWMANKNPKQLAKTQESLLYSGFTPGVHAAAFESASLWEAKESPIIEMQKKIMNRYTDSPSLGGWHINRGQPVGDMLGVLMNGCLWDSSEAGQKAYIDYLKSKYSLPELGQRWHDDKNYYKSWSDVKPIETTALLGGGYEKDRLPLSDRSWQWQKSSKEELENPPKLNSDWVPIIMPPSHRATLLDSGSGYYKVTFPPNDFIKKHANEKLYLKMLVYCYDSKRATVWVNGKKLHTNRPFSAQVKLINAEIPAGYLFSDKTNEIIIQTPDGRGDGRIHGPVSLSPAPAENYPFKQAAVNAQYVDSINFQTQSIARRIEQMIKYARKFDPNRPMTISAGSWDTPSVLMPILAKYGVGHQYTAAEGFLNAQYPGIAGNFDYYFTAESSGAVLNAEKFNRMLAHQLYLGACTFDMFHNIGQYMNFDQKTGYLTATAPLLHLVGKYLLQPTSTAIFWSSTIPLNAKVWNWNLGRGELQSSHYNIDYLNEQALERDCAQKYNLLIDCGNEVLTKKAISLLKKYVENGGTYVVLPPTGHHSQLKRDAQPISQLSGFKIEKIGQDGNIHFTKNPSIFKCWAEKTFHGVGKASDWKNVPVAARESVGLKPISKDVEVLAMWDNGDVAVGLRKIGKGRVVTLGSTFWRDGRDINGKWFPSKMNEILSTLMVELGAKQTEKADSERIWVRQAVTKNGLEHWLIAVNVAETAPYDITTNLEYQLDFKPTQIIDRISGEAIDYKVDDQNRVYLKNIDFSKYQTRFFAATRPQNIAQTAKTWWGEKTKYWHAAPDDKLPMPKDGDKDVIDLANWRFLVDASGEISKQNDWKTVKYDDNGWRLFNSGSWKLLDPGLRNYNGIGLYRIKFNIPKTWSGRTVTLAFMDPIAYDKAEFHVNGQLVTKTDIKKFHRELYGIRNFDISKYIKRDQENVLSVKVTATDPKSNLAGICNMIWLEKEKNLTPCIELNGDWEVVMEDLLTSHPFFVPGKVKGRYIRRSFDVPADWKGKNIFLHFDSPKNTLGAVMLNEKLRSVSHGFTPFPTRTEINVSDLVIPGQKNQIEIWHRHTIPVNWLGLAYGWPKESDIAIDNVKIGCEN